MIVMASASDDCVTIVLSLSHERIVFPSAELSSTLSNVDVYVEAYMHRRSGHLDGPGLFP